MTRMGRFSKSCGTTESRKIEVDTIFNDFLSLIESEKGFSYHPAKLVGDYIILVSKYRKKNLWVGSAHHWFCPFENDSFLSFWTKYTLRGLPIKINFVLVNWYLGNYPLELTFNIPTDKEMLELQCQGKRFVSLFKLKEEWLEQTPHQRDHFSFTIHDLIHAYEFFSNKYLFASQMNFYNKIYANYETLKNASNNVKYQEELSYLISDINSHPAHLESFLESLINRYQLNPIIFEKIQSTFTHNN